MSLTAARRLDSGVMNRYTHEKADAMLNKVWLWETISFPVSTAHETSPPLTCIHTPKIGVECNLHRSTHAARTTKRKQLLCGMVLHGSAGCCPTADRCKCTQMLLAFLTGSSSASHIKSMRLLFKIRAPTDAGTPTTGIPMTLPAPPLSAGL